MITRKYNSSEAGNVLFLILIAVVLFAALSYVVTQSTRSGGGSTEKERNVLSAAQITQYPTALRTAVMRMVLGGTPINQIKFNTPGQFGSISTSSLVFHPQGGGANFQDAPAEVSASGAALSWNYNANFDMPGIGLDGVGGNDVVAFLSGVTQGVCRSVNEELGIGLNGCTADVTGGTVPQAVSGITTANVEQSMTAAPMTAYTFPTTDQTDFQCNGGGTAFLRQASGCFYIPASTKYVFYSVLLER